MSQLKFAVKAFVVMDTLPTGENESHGLNGKEASPFILLK